MIKSEADNFLIYNRQHKLLKLVVTLIFISTAAGLRVWPLGNLELRIPWVTFYPAVMAAALYGGFFLRFARDFSLGSCGLILVAYRPAISR